MCKQVEISQQQQNAKESSHENKLAERQGLAIVKLKNCNLNI